MVTMAQLGEYKRGEEEIARLVRRDVRQLWDALGAIDPVRKRDLLLDMVPGLVNSYGPVAATLAAEFFADTVLLAPRIPDVDSTEKVRASTRALIGGLWTGNEALARDRLIASVTRHTRQHGRDTILESVRYAGGEVRFARILSYASKRGPCEFCTTMSSRGAVYHSEVTAGGLNDWHDDCACTAVPIRGIDDFPPVRGYEEMIEVIADGRPAIVPKGMWEEYQSVHEPGDTIKDVTAKMRARRKRSATT